MIEKKSVREILRKLASIVAAKPRDIVFQVNCIRSISKSDFSATLVELSFKSDTIGADPGNGGCAPPDFGMEGSWDLHEILLYLIMYKSMR